MQNRPKEQKADKVQKLKEIQAHLKEAGKPPGIPVIVIPSGFFAIPLRVSIKTIKGKTISWSSK